MNNLTQQIKEGAEHVLTSLSQGWRELRDRASGALTQFQSKDDDDDSERRLPVAGRWGFMAADVSDKSDEIIVRVEAPGMSRTDFRIELRDEALVVSGEKRVEQEFRGDGRYTIQSSYGAFRRTVPLPAAVDADKASATYRDGVLRVVLPKVAGANPRQLKIHVNDASVS